MFKKSSIAALQQQLAQLEVLRGDQLNGLLKRLENQKSKLPIDDHPIIDWGISLIRARIREEEQVMSEAWKKIEAQYSCSHRDFVKQSGWEPYNKDKFRSSLRQHIQEIVVAAYESRGSDRAERYARKLKNHLSNFCLDEGIVFKELIKGCEAFCIQRVEILRTPGNIDYDLFHADCYKSFSKGLKD